MSLETDCPYCGRAVGVVQRITLTGVSSVYKLVVHSVGAPSKTRRPRCQHGSGLEVNTDAVRQVPFSAQTRKSRQYHAGKQAGR